MADIVARAILKDDMSPKLQAISKNTKKAGDDAVASFRKSQKATDKLVVSTDKATQSVSRFGRVSAKASSGGVSMLRKGLGQLTLMVGVGGLAKSFFDAVTEVENLETQFVTLVGGVDEAKARMKDLSNFASTTPFQLAQVASASKTLEALTQGALSTGEGLRLVGDASAMAGVEFDSLATHVGRAYDGLQSNRPIGEAMARLQELGLMSGNTRAKIEALQKQGKGKDAWKVLEKELGKASGNMERLSKTTTGMISTIKDNWKSLLVGLNDGSFLKVPIERISLFLQLTREAIEHSNLMDGIKTRNITYEMRALVAETQKIQLASDVSGKALGKNFAYQKQQLKKLMVASKKAGLSEVEVQVMVQESRLRSLQTMKEKEGYSEEEYNNINELIARSEKYLEVNKKITKLPPRKVIEPVPQAPKTAKGEIKGIGTEEIESDFYIAEERRKITEDAWNKKLELNRTNAQIELDEKIKSDEALASQNQKVIDANKQASDKALADTKAQKAKGAKDSVDLAKAEADARLNLAMSLTSSLSTIATNALGKSKKNAKLRKAIALSEAIVNTGLGVTKALGTGVPPLNLINAGIVASVGASNISTIASQKFARGGIVKGQDGVSDLGDKTMVRVNAGEGVFTKEQMKAMGNQRSISVAPVINIQGNADSSTIQNLREESTNIANKVIESIRNGDLNLVNELNLVTA